MRVLCTVLMLGFLANMSVTVNASILSVSPTRLFVSPDSKAVAFKLKNSSDENALVEVKIYAWTDSDDRNALEATTDFLISPPVFNIPPATTQTLRLVPRIKSKLGSERMYRVVITEIPSEVGPVNGVGFAVEMSLPVFMAPEGAAADPIWSLRWKDVATPELLVANHGNAHVRVRSFELFDDPAGKPLYASDNAAYVLPGEEKAWPLGNDLSVLKGPITLKAITTKGPIETIVSHPDT